LGQGQHTLLSAGLLDLLCRAYPDQSVMWLEFLHRLVRVVDEGEARALASTIVGPEAEDADLILVGFVELGELFSKFVLGAVGPAGVKYIPNQARESAQDPYSSSGWEKGQMQRSRQDLPHTRPSVFD
jgi:hypothetical protein